MGPDAASTLHLVLEERGATLGCAESLTGGELAAALSSPPGASATFVGGVVSYATELKRRLLGVTADRVVSADCAEQMAAGARNLLGVDWALSTTGVAGPDLQEGEAVGTVYVGIAGPHASWARRLDLEGDRSSIRSATCAAAIDLLLVEVSRG